MEVDFRQKHKTGTITQLRKSKINIKQWHRANSHNFYLYWLNFCWQANGEGLILLAVHFRLCFYFSTFQEEASLDYDLPQLIWYNMYSTFEWFIMFAVMILSQARISLKRYTKVSFLIESFDQSFLINLARSRSL